MRILDRPKPMKSTGSVWLAAVETSKLRDESKVLTVAREVARLVQLDGRGELLSPIDLVRPSGLTEADAVDAINRLIVTGHLVLRYRPFQRDLLAFYVRPGPVVEEVTKASAADAAVAAAGDLPLAEAIGALTEALARLCAAEGVNPEASDGANLLETTAKLLRQRITGLLAARPRTDDRQR